MSTVSPFDRFDRTDLGWWAVALALGATLAFVLYRFVGTFVLGLFLYYAARPAFTRLRSRVGSPSLAALGALLVLALPVVLLFGYTVGLAIAELQSLADSGLGGLEPLLAPYLDVAGTTSELQTLVRSLLTDPGQLLSESRLQSVVAEVLGAAASYVGVLLTGLLHIFVALALAFYLLRDGDRLSAFARRQVSDGAFIRYARAVDADLKTIYFGNILNAFLTAIIGAISFTALAAIAPAAVTVPVPILLGLLAGAGSLVPVVGMKIVYVPVAVYLAARTALVDPTVLWFPLLFFGVALVIVDTIPDLVLRPYVSGRNLHVGSVMFAYILGPLLFGWYGLFLGPLLLVLVSDYARVVLGSPTTTVAPIRSPYGAPIPVDGPLAEPVGRSATAGRESSTTGPSQDPDS
jgi:predicted PurR-regulated permease PerM